MAEGNLRACGVGFDEFFEAEDLAFTDVSDGLFAVAMAAADASKAGANENQARGDLAFPSDQRLGGDAFGDVRISARIEVGVPIEIAVGFERRGRGDFIKCL